jgi:hypothetical protein
MCIAELVKLLAMGWILFSSTQVFLWGLPYLLSKWLACNTVRDGSDHSLPTSADIRRFIASSTASVCLCRTDYLISQLVV